ncbi:S-layer homology domain-containing protein, partial [Candidatus Margulisiibacteriota bacterium]
VKVPLDIGKNTVWVQAFDRQGKILDFKDIRALRLMTYPDVPATYWAYDQINYIGTLGIIKGYPDGGFKPEGNITRAELSTLLVRTQAGGEENVPKSVRLMFKDVPFKHWAVNYINQAAETGLVKGYPGKIFKPSDNISRVEGLTMTARFGKVSEEAYTQHFLDVLESHWAAKIVTGAYNQGLLEHFRRKPFEPKRKLTRAEAVEILYRTAPIQAQIQDLRNFEKDYEHSPPK